RPRGRQVRRAGRDRPAGGDRLLQFPRHRHECHAHRAAGERAGAAAALSGMSSLGGKAESLRKGKEAAGMMGAAPSRQGIGAGDPMPKTSSNRELPSTAPDVAAELVAWLAYLAAERRMSPKTVQAYGRDVRQFLGFLGEHLGRRPALAAPARLTPRGLRALMAGRPARGRPRPAAD